MHREGAGISGPFFMRPSDITNTASAQIACPRMVIR